MADDISIKLRLDGEKDFNNALKTCNQELKNMKSGVSEVESTSRGAANTQENLAKKVEALGKASESAQKKVDTMRQIVEKQKKAQEDAAKALEESKKEFGENSKEAEKAQDQYNKITNSVNKWETELHKAITEQANIDEELRKADGYLDEAKDSTDGLATSIDKYGKEVKDADTETEGLQKTMGQTSKMEAMDKICETLANTIGKLASNMDDAAKELDKGYDTIVKKTGATGDALEEFKDIANDVYGDLPETMEDVGSAVGEVNTRFKQSGDQLKKTSTQFIKFAHVNDTDVSDAIDDVQTAMEAFGEETKNVNKVLDTLTRTGQKTGAKVSTLTGYVNANATAFEDMGMDIYQAIDFLGQVEVSGADVSAVMQGLKKALKNATEQGKPLSDALSDLQTTILEGTDSTDGLTEAYELFGRSAPNIYQAVKKGKIRFDEITDSTDILTDSTDSLNTAYEGTLSGWDKLTTASNKLKTIGSKIQEAFYDAAAPAVDALNGFLDESLNLFNELPDNVKTFVGVAAGIGSMAAEVVPQVMNLATQLATLKIMEELAGDADGLTDGLSKLKSGFAGLKGAAGYIGVAAGTVAALAAALDDANEAIKNSHSWTADYKDEGEALLDEWEKEKTAVQTLQEELGKLNTVEEKRAYIAQETRKADDKLTQAREQYNKTLNASRNETKMTEEAEHSFWGEILYNGSSALYTAEQSYGSLTDKKLDYTESTYKQIEQAQAEKNRQDDLNSAYEDAGQVLDEAAAQKLMLWQMSQQVVQQYAKEQKAAAETADAQEEAANASISVLGEELTAWNNLDSGTQTVAQNVAEACGAMKDSITAGVDSIGNFFEEVAERETVSSDTMKQNFRDQIEALKSWEEDLNTLADKGINQELLQYMADMGPSAAGYVAAMKEDVLSGSQDTVDEWNSLYEEKLDLEGAVNDEANDLLTAIGEMSAGSTEAFNAMAEELNAATNENGQYIVAGLVDGINEALSQAEEAGQELGESTVDAVGSGAETQSPSKATKKTGEYIDQGLINGMNGKKSSVVTAAKNLGQAIVKAIQGVGLQGKAKTEAQKAGTGLKEGLDAKQSTVESSAKKLANKIASGIKAQQSTVKSAGEYIVGRAAAGVRSGVSAQSDSVKGSGGSIASKLAQGIKDNASTAKDAAADMASSVANSAKISGGYDVGWALAAGVASGINDNAYLATSAAWTMAASALASAKKALGIASPSKVFEEEVGKNAALGLAKGFNNTIGLETDGMIGEISKSMPDMSQYSAAAPTVHVYLGDRELSAILSSTVIRNIQGGVRAYGAAGGKR